MGPTKTFLNLKDLSPHLQTQVKKAVQKLLKNRLSQNLSNLKLLAQKQFRSRTKPLINFKLELANHYHQKLTIKSSHRNPFIALKSVLTKGKSFLRNTKESRLAKLKTRKQKNT